MDKFDWFNKLKIDIIDLMLTLQKLKQEFVFMIVSNDWILEDINLFESFSHLKEMIDTSDIDLTKLVEFVYKLDDDSSLFNRVDLLDEFEYIKENIHLEYNYIINMTNYMILVNDFSINGDEITEKLLDYYDNDILFYNQMKLNNKNLKQLRKERRDYFE